MKFFVAKRWRRGTRKCEYHCCCIFDCFFIRFGSRQPDKVCKSRETRSQCTVAVDAFFRVIGSSRSEGDCWRVWEFFQRKSGGAECEKNEFSCCCIRSCVCIKIGLRKPNKIGRSGENRGQLTAAIDAILCKNGNAGSEDYGSRAVAIVRQKSSLAALCEKHEKQENAQ